MVVTQTSLACAEKLKRSALYIKYLWSAFDLFLISMEGRTSSPKWTNIRENNYLSTACREMDYQPLQVFWIPFGESTQPSNYTSNEINLAIKIEGAGGSAPHPDQDLKTPSFTLMSQRTLSASLRELCMYKAVEWRLWIAPRHHFM